MTSAEAILGRAQPQITTNQQSGSQRGSFSTSSGLRNVEHQNTNPVVSKGSGFFSSLRNFFSKSSDGPSASEPQAPALESSAPRVVPKSPLISALETLVALSDKDFPMTTLALNGYTQNCTPEQREAINNALAAAQDEYIDQHSEEDGKGGYVQKTGAPSQPKFYKGKLQELLNETKASEAEAASSTEEAEAVSTPVNKKLSAYERTQQANLYIKKYNKAIDSLISQAEDKSQPLDKLKDSIPKDLKQHDKFLIASTIDENENDGNNKVIEKLRGLKREDQSIFEKSNKYVAKLFAKPQMDTVKNLFGEAKSVRLRGDSFLGKVKHFSTGYVFDKIFNLAKKPITDNSISRGMEGFIQDTSHSLKLRTAASFVAGTLGALNVAGVALKTLAIIALAATLQFVASTLTAAAVLAIPTALIALCIIKPEIGVPVLFGVILLGLIINQIFMRKEIKEQKRDILDLKADNKLLTEFNQKALNLLTQLTEEREKERRLNVSPVSSVDSSRQGSRRVSLAESQDEVQLDADNADEVDLLAQQNAGDLEAPVVNGDANAQQNAEHPVGGQQDPDAAIPLGE